jgi:hypothetical protein
MTLDIPTFIDAAGGQVVGKVRLQKLVYLLDRLGVPTGFSFSYHHYGPFSEELAEAVEDDVVFSRVEAEQRRRADGVPFVVYRALDHSSEEQRKLLLDSPGLGSLGRDARPVSDGAGIGRNNSLAGVCGESRELANGAPAA